MMFGTNPIRRNIHNKPYLRVQEIFKTIQGEGPLAGFPAIFLRLAGCNLRCTFCDTDFESQYQNAMTPEEVFWEINRLVKDTGISLLVITGGEPLLQNFLPLLQQLRMTATRKWHVQIETAGTIWLGGLDRYVADGMVSIVCSPKTGSVNKFIAMYAKAWKYIISEADYLFSLDEAGKTKDSAGLPCRSTQPEVEGIHRLYRPDPLRPEEIYLQPCDEGVSQLMRNTELAIRLCHQYGYRLCLQQHKMVGLP